MKRESLFLGRFWVLVLIFVITFLINTGGTWAVIEFDISNTSNGVFQGYSSAVAKESNDMLDGSDEYYIKPIRSAVFGDKSTTARIVTPIEPGVDAQVEASFSSISQGRTGTIVVPFTRNMSLTEMAIRVKNKVFNVKITVKALASRPAEVTQNLTGEVFRYLKVEPTNIVDADVETVTIKFKVEKQWLTNNEIDPANVVLFRYSGGEWNALPAQMSSEDSNNVYYYAESPGLSLFAISGVSEPLILEPVVVETPQPTETLAPTPAPTEAPEPTRRPTSSPYIPPEEPVPTTPSPTLAPTPVPPPKPVYMRTWFVVTELIVLLAVVIFVLYRQAKRSIREDVERLKKETNRLKEQFRRP